MAYEMQKTRLPESELGQERCFQIGYFGHGDVFAAVWEGDIGAEPTGRDEAFARFNLSHGADPVLIACQIGYLRRIGVSEDETRRIFVEAGSKILDDGEELGWRSPYPPRLEREVSGSGFPRFDLPERGLYCLMLPRPGVPGVIEEVGGTGLYAQSREDGKDLLAWVQHLPGKPEDDTKPNLGKIAEFCVDDIPVISRMVCDMSLGEYRKDIFTLLLKQFF